MEFAACLLIIIISQQMLPPGSTTQCVVVVTKIFQYFIPTISYDHIQIFTYLNNKITTFESKLKIRFIYL